MDKQRYAAARASALARMLTGAQGASTDELSALVCGLLDAAGLTPELRLEVLGGAFVSEAVRPHWSKQGSAEDAHDSLRSTDEELAEAVESIAQVLLGRAESREEAVAALAELDRLLAGITDSPREQFEQLADEWEAATRLFSSVHQMSMHTAYQRIVGMGAAALPLIFERMTKKPGHWFWALEAIAGENPVRAENAGNLQAMTEDWIVWARSRNFLTERDRSGSV